MLGDFASLDVQNTYRGSDAYDIMRSLKVFLCQLSVVSSKIFFCLELRIN
ncbi:hypothetical protein [Piscirickettsia salmonis]